jgi:TPR repeat protein
MSSRWKSPSVRELYLGAITDEGQGAATDDKAAAKRLRAAAERGDAKSQLILGFLHADGVGVPEDKVAAYMWAELAAARASGEIYRDALKLIDHLSVALDEAEIAKAQELARAFRLKRD